MFSIFGPPRSAQFACFPVMLSGAGCFGLLTPWRDTAFLPTHKGRRATRAKPFTSLAQVYANPTSKKFKPNHYRSLANLLLPPTFVKFVLPIKYHGGLKLFVKVYLRLQTTTSGLSCAYLGVIGHLTMAKPPNLTKQQKTRLQVLEPQLKVAVKNKDFSLAKKIVSDIQDILRPTGHTTRLVQIKNWLFELALELENYDYAEQGFIGNRKLVNYNTRVYLEATALLAVCYLRKKEFEKAKPYIEEVLKNDKVIATENTRRQFRKAIIERFDEESVLYSLKEEQNQQMDAGEVQQEAAILLSTKNEDEIYLLLGKQIPLHTKNILFQVDFFSKKQLPSAERKLLISSEEMLKDEVVGKTVFSSLKRVIYNSLCDPNSEVYKAWFTQGLGFVLDKKYISGAVLASLTGLGIGLKALAVSAVALILRFGLDVYCEHSKPEGVMELRKTKGSKQ